MTSRFGLLEESSRTLLSSSMVRMDPRAMAVAYISRH
jgi:hypothetical protein